MNFEAKIYFSILDILKQLCIASTNYPKMKQLSFICLSVLLFNSFLLKASTQEVKDYLSPSALVNAAHKGKLKDWDIPSYSQLQSRYDSSRITASDVVNAAVKAEILPSQAAGDEEYISQVNTELEKLHED